MDVNSDMGLGGYLLLDALILAFSFFLFVRLPWLRYSSESSATCWPPACKWPFLQYRKPAST